LKRRTRIIEFVPKNGYKQKPVKMPSIGKQITGFAKSASKVIMSKFEKVSDELYQIRLGLCRTCDYARKRSNETKCSLCGCNMELKSKFAAVKCDAGKW